MNLYRISQNVVDGYDTFDMAVVAAESEDRARKIHPYSDLGPAYNWDDNGPDNQWSSSAWCASPGDVAVTLLGTALPGTAEGLILASFNAG